MNSPQKIDNFLYFSRFSMFFKVFMLFFSGKGKVVVKSFFFLIKPDTFFTRIQ